MDAIEFFKTKERMCIYHRLNCKDCTECSLSSNKNGTKDFCFNFILDNPEQAVAIVEEWAKEHPAKTRQSEFLKLFPKAVKIEGMLDLCPYELDESEGYCTKSSEGRTAWTCVSCKHDYWLKEIE